MLAYASYIQQKISEALYEARHAEALDGANTPAYASAVLALREAEQAFSSATGVVIGADEPLRSPQMPQEFLPTPPPQGEGEAPTPTE